MGWGNKLVAGGRRWLSCLYMVETFNKSYFSETEVQQLRNLVFFISYLSTTNQMMTLG